MNAESFRTLPLRPRVWSEGCAEFDVADHGGSDSATTLISAPVLVRVPETHISGSSTSDTAAPPVMQGSSTSDTAAPPVMQGLPVLVARLQERHPAASPAMVHNCIDDAIRSFDQARVRQYLPILVERSASDALRHATHSLDTVDARVPELT